MVLNRELFYLHKRILAIYYRSYNIKKSSLVMLIFTYIIDASTVATPAWLESVLTKVNKANTNHIFVSF